MAHKIKYTKLKTILIKKLIHIIIITYTSVHELTASCYADWCRVICRGQILRVWPDLSIKRWNKTYWHKTSSVRYVVLYIHP